MLDASFMLEGEPHLNVVEEKRDIGKTRKLQVCSACVCVCVCACSHWLCTHVQYESLTLHSILVRQCKLIQVLFALFTIAQGHPQMSYLVGVLVLLLSVGLGLWQFHVSVVHLCIGCTSSLLQEWLTAVSVCVHLLVRVVYCGHDQAQAPSPTPSSPPSP